MATSGTTGFMRSRDQLITRSLRQCSAFQAGEIPQSVDITTAAEALNVMVKEWEAIGIHIWTETEGILFPQPKQSQYFLGPGSRDHATVDWVLGKTAQDILAGSNTIVMNFLEDNGQPLIFPGDNIGIVLDSGYVFWTTVASSMIQDLANPYLAVDDKGTPLYSNNPYAPLIYLSTPVNVPQLVYTVTTRDYFTGSSSAGHYVFAYTTPIERPLRIPASRRFLLVNEIDTPMLVYSRLDYRELPEKRLPGTSTAFFYDPQLNLGRYHLWPAPLDVSALFRFTWWRQIQDFNASTDNPDLPQEWINCLTWNLSKEIGPEYDVPLPKYQIIVQRAAETLDRVTGFDREPESIYFGIANTPSSR